MVDPPNPVLCSYNLRAQREDWQAGLASVLHNVMFAVIIVINSEHKKLIENFLLSVGALSSLVVGCLLISYSSRRMNNFMRDPRASGCFN